MKKYLSTIFALFLAIGLSTASKASAAEKKLDLIYNDETFSINQEQASSWQSAQLITPNKLFTPTPPSFKNSLLKISGQAIKTESSTRYYNYNLSSIYDYVKTLSEKVNVPMQEPELEIADGKVVKFTPPQEGVLMDESKTAFDILTALQVGRNSLEISYNKTEPTKSLSETNNLGISELIAHGVSTFNGSPKNRRHNISIGTEKFKGLIIKQGEEFSFNKYLGPVEADQGFLPELVIKGDKGTIPELGGGLCQVSSTTFRAAMEAGLPITQRRNHAYAVQYYAPQGTDATIYPGVVDLKFVNDTPGDILIWAYQKDVNTLIFDFYGTKDGRKVTLEKPIQYDKKTDGSMKATWTRHVVSAAGVSRTDEFKSTYQPPALFHKTEEFVPAPTPTPTTGGLQMPNG